MSVSPEEDASMSGHDGREEYEPDEEWDDCSLCDAVGDCLMTNSDRIPLPDRESLTADMEVFLHHVFQVRSAPRGKGETAFNEAFWLFIKSRLDTAVPIGFTDLPNRYQAAPKGRCDNDTMIAKFIETSPVNPIYPNVVAAMSGLSLDEVLTELLYATASGMCSMRFSPACERCGSPTCASSLLVSDAKLPVMAYCRSCRFSSPIDCMDKIKVVFVLNSEVLYALAENFPCRPSRESMDLTELYAMVPSTFSGSGFRYSVGCDGDAMLRPPMSAGKYRMHCTISASDCFFVVERDATDADEPCLVKVHVSDIVHTKGPRKVIVAPHGKFHIEIFCDTNSFFILWIQQMADDHTVFYVPPEERSTSCSALLVMNHPAYKAHFEGTEQEAQQFTRAVAQMASPAGIDKF